MVSKKNERKDVHRPIHSAGATSTLSLLALDDCGVVRDDSDEEVQLNLHTKLWGCARLCLGLVYLTWGKKITRARVNVVVLELENSERGSERSMKT